MLVLQMTCTWADPELPRNDRCVPHKNENMLSMQSFSNLALTYKYLKPCCNIQSLSQEYKCSIYCFNQVIIQGYATELPLINAFRHNTKIIQYKEPFYDRMLTKAQEREMPAIIYRS